MKKAICYIQAFLLIVFAVFSYDGKHVYAITDNYQNAEAIILSAWDNLEASADIEKCNINKDSIDDFCETLADRNPEYFYVKTDTYTSNSSGTVTALNFKYLWSNEEIKIKIQEFQRESNKILNLIPNNISDCEKLLILHDYLAVNTKYDLRVYQNINTDNDNYIRNAYGCIVNKTAVCEGISEAFLYFCKRLGIEAYAVKSNEMHHEWNMVKLGKNYYHIDITQDAYVYNLGVNGFFQPLGDISHTFFLKSDEQISDSSLGESAHYDWKAPYNASDSITYKSAFWNNSQGKINYMNGSYYYLTDGSFVKYDYKNKTMQKLFSFYKEAWRSSDGKRYIWNSNYSKSAADINNVFFTYANNIYSYNITNGSISVVFSRVNTTGFIYSIIYSDNTLSITVRDYDKNGNQEFKDYNLSDTVIPQSDLLMGDATGNGKIDISDLLSIKKYLAKQSPKNFNTACADIKLDNEINAKDALVLKKVLLCKQG